MPDVRPAKSKETGDAHGFLGPLYTEPGKTLGPEAVGEPKTARSAPDPLGLKKVKRGRRAG